MRRHFISCDHCESRVQPTARALNLTPFEKRIVLLMFDLATDEEMVAALRFRTASALRMTIRRMCEKANVRNRTELMALFATRKVTL